MLNYLKDNFEERATNGDRNEIEFFKREASRLENLLVTSYTLAHHSTGQKKGKEEASTGE